MSTVLRAVAVGLPGPAGGTLATGRSATTIVPGRSDAQVRADHARIGPAKLRARVRAQAHRRPGTARSGAPRGVRRAGRRRRARAGDGNRTRAICLEGRGSTIELHPHRIRNSCVCNQNTIARISRARRPRSSCLRHSPLQSLGFIGETAVVLAGLRACLLARISAFRFAKVAGCKIYFVGV